MGLDAEFGAPPSGRPHSPESVTVRRWRYMLMSLTVTAAVVVRGNPSMLTPPPPRVTVSVSKSSGLRDVT